MTDSVEKLTPMLAQYRSIKKEYPDALLFFRMGDFYEMFFEDAATASRELQIALTTRGKEGGNAIPMCGVPWHASQNYLAQLLNKGYNVAICDQIEDPKLSKGLVKRAVTRILTPGTTLDENTLGAKQHNYLGAVFCGMHDNCAFAWADISTGQWSGVEFRKQTDMWQWVGKMNIRELLLVDGQQIPSSVSQEGMRLVHQPPVNFDLRKATDRLLAAQKACELAALGLEGKTALTRACGAILAYLDQTQKRPPDNLAPFQPLDLGRRLLIDEVTERNLEIFTLLNGRKGKGTLREVLDETITPMGGRLLEDMLHHPWRDLKPIRQIQETVAFLHANNAKRACLRDALENVYDLERVIMRICLNRATPRDFLALKQSILALPRCREFARTVGEETEAPATLLAILNNMDDLADCAKLLEDALAEDLPAQAGEGGIFRAGFNAALDKQLDLLEHGERKLQELLEKERAETGITKLKLGFNRLLGYYYEASRSNLGNGLSERFIRRQSLANAERFYSEELKKLEEDIVLASERRKEIENEMFINLREHMAAQKERVLQTADMLAQLDYAQSLAEVGRRDGWVMPELDDSGEIHIEAGRHPVVERVAGKSNFVPNDFHMDGQKRLCLLTGPNMAGKSTILRQVALICMLAQMGSMVPATTAKIGLVDRLFSRVGASDNLSRGQSTFMVEMMETARILRQATKRSLIILDEIGRGTSTFDGMAIAWAVVEDLSGRGQGQLRTIFATHYHELTALEKKIPGVFNMSVAVGAYENNDILFLHRLLPGPADRSYGVEVARLAGVPAPVVQRAREILKNLEENRAKQTVASMELPGLAAKKMEDSLLKSLRKVKLAEITPDSALQLLCQWKKQYDTEQ